MMARRKAQRVPGLTLTGIHLMLKEILRSKPMMKRSTRGSPPRRLLPFSCLSLLLAFGMSLGMAAEPAVNDPQPPDVIDLVVTGTGKTADWMNEEAVLKPSIDSAVELEVEAASGARLVSGGRKKPFTLKRGTAEVREKMEVNVADGKARTVKVRLRLLNAEGKPWMVIDREVQVSKPGAAAPAPPPADDERVPVVQTLPDGTKIVERMTRREARARGLPENGVPAPVFRRIPMNGQPAAKKP